MLGMSIGTDSVAWSDWATATSPGALTELYDVTGSGTGINAMSLGAAWALKPSVRRDRNRQRIAFRQRSLPASAINGSVLLAIRPSYISSVMTALTELKAHVTGEITLSAAQIAAHQATIVANRWTIGISASALAAAMDLVRTYDEVLGPLWVARTVPSRASVTDDIHYTIFKVMQYIVYFGYTSTNLANHSDLLNHFAFGSSANFPGACAPPADPEQVHTAVINANYLNTWGRAVFGESSTNPSPKPTGTYLAPGSIATVTVPASMVGRNYKIRVGAHDTIFEDKTSVKRLDQCSIELLHQLHHHPGGQSTGRRHLHHGAPIHIGCRHRERPDQERRALALLLREEFPSNHAGRVAEHRAQPPGSMGGFPVG